MSDGRRRGRRLLRSLVAACTAAVFVLWLVTRPVATPPDGGAESVSRAGETHAGEQRVDVRAPEVDAANERTAAADGRQVGGRVVHSADGQGVPFVRVAVRDRTGEEEVSTDRDGRFVTRRSFAEDCELRTWDPFVRRRRPPRLLPWTSETADSDESDPRRGAPWQRLASGVERDRVEIGLATGPTYFVVAQLPEGVLLEDVLVVLARADAIAALAVRGRFEETSALQHDPAMPGAYWCRLPSDGAVGDVPAHLVLAGRRGSWCGRAPVRQVRGVQREPVVVPLVAPGTVRGVVRARDGKPRRNYPVALSQGGDAEQVRLGARTDDDGRYEFSFVMPGPAVLEVATEDVEASRIGVVVLGGVAVERDIALASRPIGGWVSGTITTDSGSPFAPCGVVLSSRDDASIWREAFVRWVEVDGRFEARWAFENVPVVPCEVTLRPGAPCGVASRSVSVTPPSVGIRFHVHDRPTVAPVTFRPVGDPEGAWSLFLSGEGGWEQRVDRVDGAEFAVGLPTGERIRWCAAGEGRRLRRGEVTAATEARVVDIEGRDGFSALVVCSDVRNLHPVAGAQLLADGAAVAPTDAAGRAWIDLSARPARLGMQRGAWSIQSEMHVPADVAADGTFRLGREGATLRVLLQAD